MIGRWVRCLGATIVLLLLLLTAAPAMARFGFEGLSISLLNGDGTPDVQAGSHPFEMVTIFSFKTKNAEGRLLPVADAKDLAVELPPGVVGDPSATPKCTAEEFHTQSEVNNGEGSNCPGNTQIGTAVITVTLGLPAHPLQATVGVFNLAPPAGIPAAIGFNPFGLAITLVPSVRTGGDNGLTATVENISQVQGILASSVTLWGVPGESSHDGQRGACITAEPGSGCAEASGAGVKPFLRMPTSCSGAPLITTLRADPWQEPGSFTSIEAADTGLDGRPVILSGCGRLDFSPGLSVTPQSSFANSPTSVSVDLHMPQNETAVGLGEADLKDATVTLPPGLVVNPSAADGLAACSPQQIEIHSAAEPTCPDASKIGTVEVVTPLLEEPLEGDVFQAEQGNNPFESLLAFYIVAHGPGVTVKLPGKVVADPLTGQLTTSVENAPQLPFGDFKLNFFGGPRAALMTPGCGTYAASASLVSWAGGMPVTPTIQPLSITENCGGGFAPSFTAGTESNQAGGFSPFVTSISRTDQDQKLSRVSVKIPQGVLGMLSKVSLCGDAQAEEGACSAASQIGHVTASAGAGPNPVFLPQAGRQEDPVYLTGSYKGGALGLAIVVHPEAGPFDLGPKPIVVRAGLYVDPHTAQVTVVTDPLPTIVKGIPLDVRSATVTIDRAGTAGANQFIFNPTNCEPLSATGAIASTQGASASVSSRFQAADCASLPFKPKFTVSTWGGTSKKLGASLDVKVTSGAGQANIGKVHVTLPKQLPARLTTLQKACTEAAFAQNPATCPAASDVGFATAITPVLSLPLTGPAYLVSHGGAAFPDLVVVLQGQGEGQGLRLDLVGNTNIKKSITTSTFSTVPDAPISSFELKLPQGPYSALGANLPASAHGGLCGTKLIMPTTITGQNGAQIQQSTRIAVAGCPKAHKASRTAKARRRA